MNREIKFRAWHIDLEDMTFSIEDNSKFWSKVDEYPSMYHVMQLTGLKDKNGKGIYEGDILRLVETDKRYWQIIWLKYGWGFIYLEHKLPIINDLSSHMEIIGNVYENPHLLDSEQKNSIANIDNQ